MLVLCCQAFAQMPVISVDENDQVICVSEEKGQHITIGINLVNALEKDANNNITSCQTSECETHEQEVSSNYGGLWVEFRKDPKKLHQYSTIKTYGFYKKKRLVDMGLTLGSSEDSPSYFLQEGRTEHGELSPLVIARSGQAGGLYLYIPQDLKDSLNDFIFEEFDTSFKCHFKI